MKKTIFTIALLLAAVLVLQGCTTTGSDPASPTATPAATAAEESVVTDAPAATDTPAATDIPAADTGEKTFTLDELAMYDGSNGNPAYIAVDGVVYDVTNVAQWRGGQHNGFTAGHDLTTEIKTVSPHGVSKLVGLVVVGKLVD